MGNGEGVLLQLLEDVPPRVVLLLVRKPQVPHVLAEYLDAVRVLSPGRGTAHLLYPRHHPEGHLDNVGHVLVYRTKIQLVIGDGEDTARRPVVRAEVGDVAGLSAHTFPGQEGSLVRAVG